MGQIKQLFILPWVSLIFGATAIWGRQIPLPAIPIPTTPATTNEAKKTDCKDDSDCETGQFCDNETFSCAPCLECSEFYLKSGFKNCGKGLGDCAAPTHQDSKQSGVLDWMTFVLKALGIVGILKKAFKFLRGQYRTIRTRQSSPCHLPSVQVSTSAATLTSDRIHGQGQPQNSPVCGTSFDTVVTPVVRGAEDRMMEHRLEILD